MKKIFILVIVGFLATSTWAAQQPITEITPKQSRQDIRTAINAQVVAPSQSNFTQIWEALNGSPWLVQTTAPNIYNVFWIDTSGTSPTIKYWDGDSWEVAASGAEVNVNADWNASSGDAQILNKPTIPTVSDTAYGSGWNDDTGAASKNAIYDKIETLSGSSLPAWLPATGPTDGRQILQATGGCSNTTYDTQATCEANAGIWTIPVYVNTSILSGLINDAGSGTDDLLSASKIITMLAAKDNKQPSTLSLTEDITVTSSQLLDNKYLSNHGATGTVKIILPAVEYQITRTAIVEAAYTVKICPPSGESLNVNSTDLTVDYCTISPVIVGSKTTVTRRKNGVSWIWDVDGVRGTWMTGL